MVALVHQDTRPVGRGGARGAHAPPRSQKSPPDGIVKDLTFDIFLFRHIFKNKVQFLNANYVC